MITPQPARPAPVTASRVRSIQSAEMVDQSGIKAVFTTGGLIFVSLTPETAAEAASINAAVAHLND